MRALGSVAASVGSHGKTRGRGGTQCGSTREALASRACSRYVADASGDEAAGKFRIDAQRAAGGRMQLGILNPMHSCFGHAAVAMRPEAWRRARARRSSFPRARFARNKFHVHFWVESSLATRKGDVFMAGKLCRSCPCSSFLPN